jgi:hypothetical protein
LSARVFTLREAKRDRAVLHARQGVCFPFASARKLAGKPRTRHQYGTQSEALSAYPR